jgi:hypothetical protein
MNAGKGVVGVAGAARPAQTGKQGGPAPETGARCLAVELDVRTLYGRDGEILDMLRPLFERMGWYWFEVDETTLRPIKSDVWGSWEAIVKAHAFKAWIGGVEKTTLIGKVGFNGKTFAYFEEVRE